MNASTKCNVVAVTLATSEYRIQRIALEDTLAKGLVSSFDFSCRIGYNQDSSEWGKGGAEGGMGAWDRAWVLKSVYSKRTQ